MPTTILLLPPWIFRPSYVHVSPSLAHFCRANLQLPALPHLKDLPRFTFQVRTVGSSGTPGGKY